MTKMSVTFILLAFLVTTVSMAANKKVFPYKARTEVLSNGLKVIMIPMQTKGSLAYYTVVRTGSRDEYEPDHSGFAHFFEHMMFRGTKKYPGNVYDKIITSIGADANAYTSDDITCFHLKIASEDLEKVMELESDRFQNLWYPEREFQTESGAVYGEYRKSKTSPYFLLEEKMNETAFDVHTYKHTTMGFEKDIAAMPTMYDYSRSFFKRYYRPENCVLLIVGDFDQSKTLGLIRNYYGNWKKGYQTPPVTQEPEQKTERNSSVKYSGKTLPILTLAYKSPAYNPEDRTALAGSLLSELAFGDNSDVFKKLYLKEQKVQSIMTDFGNNRDPYLWVINAQIKSESDINYIKNELSAAIDYFKTSLVTLHKLDALKKKIKYQFLMNLDTPDKVAGSLARTIAITGGIDAVDKFYATLEKISPEDIKTAANKYFAVEKRTVVTLSGSK